MRTFELRLGFTPVTGLPRRVVRSPHGESPVGEVPVAGPAELAQAVPAGRAAVPAMAALAPHARIAILEGLAGTIRDEAGKPNG